MSKLITQNDLQDILNEALPTPRYGGVQTASWTANSSAANNVKLTDSIHLTAGTYVITVKYPGISATLSTAIQYGTGTLLDSFCTSAGAAYSSHSYVINISSELDIFVVSATSTSITYTYKERGGLRAIQIAESKASSNEVDYIVEQGTSGNWIYRKWNSGVAECWCHHRYTPTGSTAWGGVYYTTPNTTATYPTGLFIEEPITNVFHVASATQGMPCVSSADSEKIVFSLVRGTSGSGNELRFNIYAIGTWK